MNVNQAFQEVPPVTYFRPTRADMMFRLFVSILGFALLAFALAFRGMPVDAQSILMLTLALAFLAASALISVSRLRHWDDT